jgi:hypothetical protein
MNYHRFAQSLWSARLQRGGDLSLSSVETLKILLEHFPCPALESLVDTAMGTYRESRGDSERAAIVVDRRWSDQVVPVLWSCASDRDRGGGTDHRDDNAMTRRLRGP